MLVYDVNDPQSFEHAVGRWMDDVKANSDEEDHAVMLAGTMLLGNKCGTFSTTTLDNHKTHGIVTDNRLA